MTARILGLVFLALALSSSASSAGWTPNGATIRSTTNAIPKIAAANDGAFGTFVVWQEESAPGSGVLRVQHVLASGDADPAWPGDGLEVCSVSAARTQIGLVPDRLGGAYVWWKEGTNLFLSRVTGGAVAAAWPARGRQLGATRTQSQLPAVLEDGASGVYVAWVATALGTDMSAVDVVHLGPGNTGAGGWPNSIRTASSGDPVATVEYWPHLALASDGGVFVAWAQWSSDEAQVPSAFRLRRMTSAGLNATGWPSEGLVLGDFHGEWFGGDPKMSLLGLAEDGLGGVFAMLGLQTGFDGTSTSLETRVYRLQETGAPRAGWPIAGTVLTDAPSTYVDVGTDASYQVFRDDGFAEIGFPTYYDHATTFGVAPTTSTGGWTPYSGTGGTLAGHEVVRGGEGNVFFADFYPHGATGPYEPNAYLRVSQSNPPSGWTDFVEHHDQPVVAWYGDIGLAESGDGGAVLYWSQVQDRFGLFARRFNGASEVTGVSPPLLVPAPLEVTSLRFVAGEGVRASVSVPDGESARLELFDVSGRRVASSSVASSDAGRPLTLGGTRGLASGLYFAKLATAHASASGKVVVAR